MIQTWTTINVSAYVEGDTWKANQDLLAYLYDCLRNVSGIDGSVAIELEAHDTKETAHYDTETATLYVGELWVDGGLDEPVPVEHVTCVDCGVTHPEYHEGVVPKEKSSEGHTCDGRLTFGKPWDIGETNKKETHV